MAIGESIGSFFAGTPAQLQQPNRFNPQQMQAILQILQGGMQQFQNPTQGFAPIADQARRQFNEITVPSLAERFTSMGAGAQSSPAFAQLLGSAGVGLEGNLAAQQAQYGLQSRGQGLQALGLGLTDPYLNIQTPQQGGFLQQILPQLAQAGLRAGAAYATGGTSEAGNAISSLLSMLAQGS
jgi:hypothetical protein